MIRFNDALPLRTTAAWPGFREATVIPHRYGRTGGTCHQHDQGRTSWVWADHAIDGIDQVLVDGVPVSNWQARNALDAVGHTVAMIEFDAGVTEGSTVTARGRGKLSTRSGQLIESPADIVHDLLANVAGRPVPTARLAAFRSACDAAGIVLGGSVYEPTSILAALRDVCASAGAVIAPDARELCHLWPSVPNGARARVEPHHDLSARSSLGDVATVLVLRYGHEDGSPTASVELEARAAVARLGRRVLELDCAWIRTARVAVAVGTRILQQRARECWQVNVSGLTGDIRVGDSVSIDHARLPGAALHMVLGRTLDPTTLAVDLSFEIPCGSAPAVRVVGLSSMLAPEQYISATIQPVADEYLLTLKEEDGRPIAFASVTLDGQMVRSSDAAGRVRFPRSAMPPGIHRFDVLTADGRTLGMEREV